MIQMCLFSENSLVLISIIYNHFLIFFYQEEDYIPPCKSLNIQFNLYIYVPDRTKNSTSRNATTHHFLFPRLHAS